jgi:hypothetical protein
MWSKFTPNFVCPEQLIYTKVLTPGIQILFVLEKSGAAHAILEEHHHMASGVTRIYMVESC